MGERKDYLWPLPFIGGIVSLISLMCPSVYFIYGNPESIFGSRELFLWMWSLAYHSSFGPSFGISVIHSSTGDDFQLLIDQTGIIIGAIFSILILINSGLLIVSANRVRIRKLNLQKATYQWIIYTLCSFLLTIGWMVFQEIYIQQTSTYNSQPFDFWGYFIPGFGIIGLFITVFLMVADLILLKVL